MANSAELKIPSDIEFRVISNGFGLLVASAGLLGGTMMRERSLEYWTADLVPLVFTIWLSYRLFRNFISTMLAYQDEPPMLPQQARQIRETIKAEKVAVGQISAKTGFTPEQVIEEVAKRIEAQKAAAAKNNKFTE